MGVALTMGLSKLVEETAKSSQWMNSSEMVEKLVTELAKTFQVKPHEVAILHVTHGGSVLSFIYPFKLQKVGSVPMSSTASLAVRTVREKRPEMVNNFPAQKHATVFEAVNLSAEAKGSPIQKIMSAPLISEGKAVGVIQVSRKGKDPPSAGPDFTIKDLTTLMTTAGILAKLFKAAK
jgi:transcriptional regulator with GAF, ATPase, and Fis domain